LHIDNRINYIKLAWNKKRVSKPGEEFKNGMTGVCTLEECLTPLIVNAELSIVIGEIGPV
jgi:hypothetical protein